MSNSYLKKLAGLFPEIEASDEKGQGIPFGKAISEAVGRIGKKKGAKLIFIGNGGSASIASHMTADFLKNGGLPALAFNDPCLITCLSNDIGYERVFETPLKLLARKEDILFSISSSGKSRNILEAVSRARERGLFIITLSGFSRDNPLRSMGNINFYVPSYSYGLVEISHLAVCHCIADSAALRK